MRKLALLTGWLALAALLLSGAMRGSMEKLIEAGTWIGSLVAFCGFLALFSPGIIRIALPVAGLSVIFGGAVFSLLPQGAADWPVAALLLVTLPLAALLGQFLLREPGTGRAWRIGAALAAGVCQVGLIHGLVPPPLISPFFLYPSALLPILLAWCAGAGLGRLSAAPVRRSAVTG